MFSGNYLVHYLAHYPAHSQHRAELR